MVRTLRGLCTVAGAALANRTASCEEIFFGAGLNDERSFAAFQCSQSKFKALFNVFIADEVDGFDSAKVMPMVKAMGVVIANHPPVVSGMKVVIDIGEVVARNPPWSSIHTSRRRRPFPRLSGILCDSS